MTPKYSKCPFQCVEGGLIGTYEYPDCIGSGCAGFIVFSSTCHRTGQVVRPHETTPAPVNDTTLAILQEIEAGISTYENENKRQQVCDDSKGMYIPINVVRRLIQVRKERHTPTTEAHR